MAEGYESLSQQTQTSTTQMSVKGKFNMWYQSLKWQTRCTDTLHSRQYGLASTQKSYPVWFKGQKMTWCKIGEKCIHQLCHFITFTHTFQICFDEYILQWFPSLQDRWLYWNWLVLCPGRRKMVSSHKLSNWKPKSTWHIKIMIFTTNPHSSFTRDKHIHIV